MVPIDLYLYLESDSILYPDFLRPLEILKGQCLCDFNINDPQKIENWFQDEDVFKNQILINRMIKPKDYDYFKKAGMYRYNHEISNDLHMMNSLERCFNLTPDEIYSTSAEFMIAHVFRQEKTMQY